MLRTAPAPPIDGTSVRIGINGDTSPRNSSQARNDIVDRDITSLDLPPQLIRAPTRARSVLS